jgi:hypothetical protein
MNLLDTFGPLAPRYQGIGKLWPGVSKDLSEDKEAYFQVGQAASSRIVVACMTSAPIDPAHIGRLVGVTEDGFNLVISPLIPIQLTDRSNLRTCTALATQMTVWGMGRPFRPTQIVFSLANLGLEQSASFPRSFETEIGDYSLRFEPVSDYSDIYKKLRQASGISATATCTVRKPGGARLQLPKVAELVDNVCTPLSLATGTKVTWVSYSADNPYGAVSVYRSSVTKPYSNVLTNLGWRLHLPALLDAWVTSSEKTYVRLMTDYFIDATNEEAYMETRILTAASLLDALTNHYAAQHDFDFIVNETEWTRLRPPLRKAMKQATISTGFPSKLGEKLGANVNSLRRYPLAQKLSKMLDDLDLPTNSVDRVIAIRDSIVHAGSVTTGKEPFDDYRCLLWVPFAILARLAGYRDEIPASLGQCGHDLHA